MNAIAIALPSVDQTCRELGHSKATAIRDRLLLRVSRWISLCQRVRAPDTGRFRGNVHAIHGEPCSLADATYLDREYVKLLDDAAKDHYDPYDSSLLTVLTVAPSPVLPYPMSIGTPRVSNRPQKQICVTC